MTILLDGEPSARLLGHQTPRIHYKTEGDTQAGDDAIEMAADQFGIDLDPWQQLVVREGLKERPEDGQWAAKEVGLMVSRQSGKSESLVVIELAGLFLFGDELQCHSSHQFSTAADAMRRLHIALTRGGIKHKAVGTHGQERIEILAGEAKDRRVMFITRTKGAGLGFPIDRLILDEAMMISPESYQALLPTISARPNGQIWLTGSAVDQRIHAGCEQFAGIRSRAMTSAPGQRFTYMEWSADESLQDFGDREAWWQANPGAGIRITEEDIESEYESFKASGGLRAFGVQRLGIGDWPVFGAARSEIPSERWSAMTNEPTLTGPNVLTLYRAPEGGPWAIGAAQRTDDSRIHLEIGYSGKDPSDQVVRKLVDAITEFAPTAVIVGRGGAAEVLPELEAAGIEAVVPTLGEEAQACGGFLNDCFVEPTPLSHSYQSGLTAAVSAAIKRDLSTGGFVWAAINESHAELMAASLSRWALLKYGVESNGFFIFDWDDIDDESA